MSSPRALKVFLCHASQDKSAVRTLYVRLKNESWLDPWLDEEKILGGQDWDSEIRKAVRVSDIIIVCLSKASVTKEGYVQKEIRLALDIADEKPEATIFIIPLKIQKCNVPDRLKKRQWIDFFEDEEGAFNWLLYSLSVRAKSLGVSSKVKQVSFRTKALPKEKVSSISKFHGNLRERVAHIDETLKQNIHEILRPFNPENRVHVDAQRVFGGIIELFLLLLFLYATAIQVWLNFSFLVPEISIPETFQNISIPLILGTAGEAIVLGVLLGELTGLTNYMVWSTVKGMLRELSIWMVVVTLVMTIILAVFISLARLAVTSELYSQLTLDRFRMYGSTAQTFMLVPLLITTALLFRGVEGVLVIFAFLLYLIKLPFSFIRTII